jgi:hypothetical protein
MHLYEVHGIGGWTEMTIGVGDPKPGRGSNPGSKFFLRRKDRAWSRMESTAAKDTRYDFTSLDHCMSSLCIAFRSVFACAWRWYLILLS